MYPPVYPHFGLSLIQWGTGPLLFFFFFFYQTTIQGLYPGLPNEGQFEKLNIHIDTSSGDVTIIQLPLYILIYFDTGMSGRVVLNDQADRIPDFWLWSYSDVQVQYDELMEVAMTRPVQNVRTSLYKL